jgi:hypothetical protein
MAKPIVALGLTRALALGLQKSSRMEKPDLVMPLSLIMSHLGEYHAECVPTGLPSFLTWLGEHNQRDLIALILATPDIKQAIAELLESETPETLAGLDCEIGSSELLPPQFQRLSRAVQAAYC